MRGKGIGVACALVVVAGAFAAQATAAAPVFYTKAVVGEVAKSVKFTGTLGAAFLEGHTSKAKITCLAGTGGGEVTGATTAKHGEVIFTGCETSKLPCTSSGEAEGTIKTLSLQGVLGGLNATTPGVRLFSEATGRGGVLAEFQCGGGLVNVIVTGSVIGSLTGASGTEAANGKFAASAKLAFAETSGIQKYVKFTEGEAGEEQLTSSINGTPELGGQSVTATIVSVPASDLGYTK